MMGYGWMGNGMFWGVWWFIMLAFWGLVLLGAVLVVRWLTDRETATRPGAGRMDAPLEALAERYARGEIDRREFETKKQDLTA